MLKTLDPSMLGLGQPIEELAPAAAKYGFQAISASASVLEDRAAGREASAVLLDNGLSWGLMPMPADFYHWELEDSAFKGALETLRRWADAARVLGITHAYNHVWPCSSRGFDENFAWTVERIRAVNGILKENGVAYGLEFLGPHGLRELAGRQFIHSLSGALALADAAGGGVGIAFDTFHWYCSQNGAMDDVALMEQHIDRLVALHINDGVPGRDFSAQQDMERRLPGETGVIDAGTVLERFKRRGSSALYMAEPFEPWRTRLGAMTAEEAVSAVSRAIDRLTA